MRQKNMIQNSRSSNPKGKKKKEKERRFSKPTDGGEQARKISNDDLRRQPLFSIHKSPLPFVN